ncbi:MAG TPA: glycosyltransferase family 4 protein [Acidimicrobiia bacterium]|nr:glycosyltransferase family 4 protein [Acidimicrobiia bacterium]
MIAPVTHPYPPPGYGPWERVTHDLTESLVELGHDVTLFAAAGSETKANLVATTSEPLEELPAAERRDEEDRHIAAALEGAADADLDIVHSHLHVHVLRQVNRLACPLVTTLHGAAWDRAHHRLLRRHHGRPFVSLSDAERAFLPELNYVATIPNGIDTEDFPPGDGSGGYLAFVGRLAPEKAPHLAVEVAHRSGDRLLLAGVTEDQHRVYAHDVLSSTGSDVDYLGPLDRAELSSMLRSAKALVMPLLWDEPFGLVVVESLASGTPVVAWDRGAMSEIIDHGETGFLVADVDEAVKAVGMVSHLSRRDCAERARERFSARVMADGYARLYRTLTSPSRR